MSDLPPGYTVEDLQPDDIAPEGDDRLDCDGSHSSAAVTGNDHLEGVDF